MGMCVHRKRNCSKCRKVVASLKKSGLDKEVLCPHKVGRMKQNCFFCSPSLRCIHVGKDVTRRKSSCVLCSPHLACAAHPTEHVRTRCPDYQRTRRANKLKAMGAPTAQKKKRKASFARKKKGKVVKKPAEMW